VACAAKTQSSLPKALASKVALESTYHLFAHASVSEEAILQPHRDETRQRCLQASTVLVAHDTTEFVFSTHREGLGHLRSVNDHGFLMHGSLALTADGHRRPLGVLGAHFWTRSLEGESCKEAKKKRRSRTAADTPLESARWFAQCVVAEAQAGPLVSCMHVMDREGDSYELFAKLLARGSRFIIRNRVNRVARSEDEGPSEHIRTICEHAPVEFETLVPIARREAKDSPTRGTSLLARDARTAKLSAKAVALRIRKPPYLADLPMWLDLNVVYVSEVDTPEGLQPVEWILITTEPIDSLTDIMAVIEHYRARWIIEEWFKAIKTGCQVEKLQLETYDSLKNAIAMYLVLAWRMLVLRALARDQPEASAEVALSPSELGVLRLMQPDARLPTRPNVAQAFIAVAMMGGYIKHRVPPGWLTLARGFEKLILLERGWTAGRRSAHDGRDP